MLQTSSANFFSSPCHPVPPRTPAASSAGPSCWEACACAVASDLVSIDLLRRPNLADQSNLAHPVRRHHRLQFRPSSSNSCLHAAAFFGALLLSMGFGCRWPVGLGRGRARSVCRRGISCEGCSDTRGCGRPAHPGDPSWWQWPWPAPPTSLRSACARARLRCTGSPSKSASLSGGWLLRNCRVDAFGACELC